MEGMIKAMSEDEKIGMVLFYASQQVAHKSAERADLAARGQQIYQSNCFLCHGNDGRGQASIARIAGQQPEYLAARLKRYRGPDGSRANPMMAQRARMLDEGDIEAVVTYVSSMP
jgi:cytochrome c553